MSPSQDSVPCLGEGIFYACGRPPGHLWSWGHWLLCRFWDPRAAEFHPAPQLGSATHGRGGNGHALEPLTRAHSHGPKMHPSCTSVTPRWEIKSPWAQRGVAGAICWDRFFYWKWYRCILIGRYGSFPWITLFRISENGCLGKQNLRHSSRFSMYLETSQTRYEAYQTCLSLLDETEAISIFIKKM